MTTFCRPLVAVIILITLVSCGEVDKNRDDERTVEIEGRSYTCERLTNSKCDLRIQNAFNRWGGGIDSFVNSKGPKTPSLTTGPIVVSTNNAPRSGPASIGSGGGTTSTTAPRSKATSSASSGAAPSEMEYGDVARLGLEACAVTLEGKKQNAFVDLAQETHPELPSTAFPPLWRGAHDELCPDAVK